MSAIGVAVSLLLLILLATGVLLRRLGGMEVAVLVLIFAGLAVIWSIGGQVLQALRYQSFAMLLFADALLEAMKLLVQALAEVVALATKPFRK